MPKKKRIVFVGAGPTTLGALYRLHDMGILRMNNLQIIVLEQEQEAGGLASSTRDNNSFLWDNGGHVVFSHYEYFDNALNKAIGKWNKRKRASFAYMMGGDGERRFIPYPVQNSIHFMDRRHQNMCISGLEEAKRFHSTENAINFKEWLMRTFGTGLFDVFMNKYNKKVWTVDASEMNSVWVGERVAVPDIDVIKANIAKAKENKLKGEDDSTWGPNNFFRFPQHGGTGEIWKQVAAGLPQGWFHFGHKVTELSLENKQIKVELIDRKHYVLSYDILISTAPLDLLVEMVSDNGAIVEGMKELAEKLIYSHTHIVGIGLFGRPPQFLADKSWIYFPDSDAPFYRATLFSSYANDNVPDGRVDVYWSLMCEVAEPKTTTSKNFWTKENLIKETIKALHTYNYIRESKIVSKYYHKLDHGYPVPTVNRESILEVVQPWLQSHFVYSRGRFGGWRYEVGNQDHSFMQGVEIVDYLLSKIEEETYTNPGLVNSMKSSNRTISRSNNKMEYELVVAASGKEADISWLTDYANSTHVYHQTDSVSIPDFRFHMWNSIDSTEGGSCTFLYHIFVNYYLLADTTIFLLGDSQISCKISNHLKEARITGLSFGKLKKSENWGKDILKDAVHSKDYALTFDDFWELYFSRDLPSVVFWSDEDCFAVSRSRILRKPRIFYEKLMLFMSSPLEQYYMKMLWYTIFTQ